MLTRFIQVRVLSLRNAKQQSAILRRSPLEPIGGTTPGWRTDSGDNNGNAILAGLFLNLPITEQLFNLKFAAKELSRNSKRCDKEEKAEKLKVKKAIQKGNTEVARIHAENAIRQKNQSINFLRMSARVDAVAARVQTAVTMNKVSRATTLKPGRTAERE
ncbi:UNVERIFIED_CONTAM: hypothetical protein FKN15_063900 [Acipenser sinensis]